MPESDGVSALKALRRIDVTRETPVVFITASAQPRDLARYAALGCLGVIRKPFNPISLAETLESLWRPEGPGFPRGHRSASSRSSGAIYLGELPGRMPGPARRRRDSWPRSGGTERRWSPSTTWSTRLAGSSGLYRMSELSRSAGILEHLVKRLLTGPTWPPASSPAELTTLVKAVGRPPRTNATGSPV